MEEKKLYKQNENKQFEQQKIEIEEEKLKFHCPHCSSDNEKEAIFCCECGKALKEQKKCPRCGSSIPVESIEADICEKCGEWLLEGQCKFCYAELEYGATFCSVCGNPVAGIICSKCGKLSYFDFCKNCNIPLTQAAKDELKELENDPEQQELLKLLQMDFSEIKINKHDDSNDANQKQSDREILKHLKEYTDKIKEKEKLNKKVNDKSDPVFQAAEELKRLDEEDRRKEKERKKLLEKMEKLNKTFKDNQEARRYFSKYKPKQVQGWLCNFGWLHWGPEQCSLTMRGGRWVLEGEPVCWHTDVRHISYIV